MSKNNSDISYINDALCSAALLGHSEIAVGLVKLGADVHWNDEEPLRRAANSGQLETVKALVRAGADLQKAIYVTASEGRVTSLKLLLACEIEDPHSKLVKTFEQALNRCPHPCERTVAPKPISP